jgi:hypothetical protein
VAGKKTVVQSFPSIAVNSGPIRFFHKSSQNKDVLVKLSASEQATLSSLLSLDFEKVITQGVYGSLAEGARILAKALMDVEVTSLCGER